MKKRIILVVTIIVMLIVGLLNLTGCNNKNKENNNENKTPVGLYRLVYTGNAEGEYVEEYNVYSDFYGNPTTLQETMYNHNDALYYSLNSDGTGFYIGAYGNKVDAKITETTLTNDQGIALPYKLKDDKIILSSEGNTEKFDVFEKTNQKMIDLILAGKGGSVPIEEARNR